MVPIVGILVAGAVAAGWRARAARAAARRDLIAGLDEGGRGRKRTEGDADGGPGSLLRAIGRVDPRLLAIVFGVGGAVLLGHLAGPVGWPAGAAAGAAVPLIWARRARARIAHALEIQLGDLVESCALAVRAGLSIPRAIEFASTESRPPLQPILGRCIDREALGVPFDRILEEFADAVGTDDARLFVLVLGVHARSGGDLAGALEDVATTIRARVSIRRELRALSAQGRISGGVLGSLPLLFFLVLAATSRSELDPVYHSAAGLAMIVGGLAMQASAYVWVRHLLRVEA